MLMGDKIFRLRREANLSQEDLAEILNVSRQAVQRWESGAAKPDVNNLIGLSKQFNVSVDSLLFDSDTRVVEELQAKKILPDYGVLHAWEAYSEQMMVEYRQSVEEGLDIEEYQDLFTAVHKLPKSDYKEKMADVIFDMVLNAKKKPGYAYDEPSDLEGIKEKRKAYDFEKKEVNTDALKSKIHGAWMGRIIGCFLGKPVEGIRTDELHPLLKETGNWPMKRYILAKELTDEICDKYKFRLKKPTYADLIEYAPVDDDTNYTVLSQIIVEKNGRDFSPYDVAQAWLQYQSKNAYCTAERVAFCNFVKGYLPPHSAIYKNAFREWIGAQIRGDYFGYINPGNPELAAEMAWRDASISHVKNGIYGEMFIAAMLACAAVTDNIEDIIYGGLAQIPEQSRLYEAIDNVVKDYKNGVTQAEAFAKLHTTYDEHDGHDWCHTISNAIIVAAALLYGEGDFGKSICMAVETGFDTDCNGATVGSILGMRNGIEGIGKEWSDPIHGELNTSIFGVGKVKVIDLVEKTMNHIEL